MPPHFDVRKKMENTRSWIDDVVHTSFKTEPEGKEISRR